MGADLVALEVYNNPLLNWTKCLRYSMSIFWWMFLPVFFWVFHLWSAKPQSRILSSQRLCAGSTRDYNTQVNSAFPQNTFRQTGVNFYSLLCALLARKRKQNRRTLERLVINTLITEENVVNTSYFSSFIGSLQHSSHSCRKIGINAVSVTHPSVCAARLTPRGGWKPKLWKTQPFQRFSTTQLA